MQPDARYQHEFFLLSKVVMLLQSNFVATYLT